MFLFGLRLYVQLRSKLKKGWAKTRLGQKKTRETKQKLDNDMNELKTVDKENRFDFILIWKEFCLTFLIF